MTFSGAAKIDDLGLLLISTAHPASPLIETLAQWDKFMIYSRFWHFLMFNSSMFGFGRKAQGLRACLKFGYAEMWPMFGNSMFDCYR